MKLKFLFMNVVLDFISDWYSIHRITSRPITQIQNTLSLINKLRGYIRDKIEEENNENEG